MQATDLDKTADMPKQLPKDFFIPEADYDAATRDTGKTDPAHDISGGGQPQPSAFMKNIDDILKKSNVSAKAMEAIHQAMQKEFEALSEEVGARVRQG